MDQEKVGKGEVNERKRKENEKKNKKAVGTKAMRKVQILCGKRKNLAEIH